MHRGIGNGTRRRDESLRERVIRTATRVVRTGYAH